MKRIICLLIAVVMLSGCSFQAEEDPFQPTQEVTEPPKPWVEEQGTPWDEEGTLSQLRLTVPGGLEYTHAAAFDGDMLLWNYDDHRQDRMTLDLCLIELDSGTVAAQREIALAGSVSPQILGDGLYLCDNLSGDIYRLDKQLKTVQSWTAKPGEESWYMGGNGTLYTFDWYGSVTVIDLSTGSRTPFLDGCEIAGFFVNGTTAMADCYLESPTDPVSVLLDLNTGEIFRPPVEDTCLSLDCREGTWLWSTYYDGYTYFLGQDAAAIQMTDMGDGQLGFVNGETLYSIDGGSTELTLYSLDGTALAMCRFSERAHTFGSVTAVENRMLDGFFLILQGYESGIRLLFWDPDRGSPGEDLAFTAMPQPSEEEQLLNQRVTELEKTYGVNIVIGTECDLVYDSFHADAVTEYIPVSQGMDILETALSHYPADFFSQLRYGDVSGVEVQLVMNLRSVDSEGFPGSYNAFAQDLYDRHLIVVDIGNSTVDTYHHEISHVIDTYLEWDSWLREDALFSEEAWYTLNPGWFSGYSYSYAQEHALEDFDSFIDTYATVSPTEDRARVMEYAMMDYDSFSGTDVLYQKLWYYSACIRDAFDTTGWPEILLWEQYL